jgi:mono/diheme cytochrome c family protein
MNYPIWELPASGLLIAVVAILHVFVSHFAVGGGLFLVVTEGKARRENDDELLAWLKRHSRFFILLTLVFGAVSGVGIWFTIGLVHPAATSSLINTFVWGWAIEWTFFVTEIAAALVYYYGWDRLSPKRHLAIGWIYFVSAWASLIVINGILAYMLTPGAWLASHGFVDGFFNPTYWPSVVIRTLGAIGLAGVYALFTASWLASPELKRKLARHAALQWVLPMAIGLPIALLWYFAAADAAGVPVKEIFGSATAGARDLIASMFSAQTSGHPVAQRALRTAFASITATILLVFALFLFRRDRFGRFATGAVMLAGLFAIGGSEWVREDLRKPFVIGSYMYVNGSRVDQENDSVLANAHFARVRSVDAANEAGAGREVFRLTCSQCHTTDGYLAMRPLVRGRSSASMEGMLEQLATWRHRRMPPFLGNDDERRALAVYLATLGGGRIEPRAAAVDGGAIFEASCAMCHAAAAEWPMQPRVAGRSEAELYEILGELANRNPLMPPFEGTDAERRALAKHLAILAVGR